MLLKWWGKNFLPLSETIRATTSLLLPQLISTYSLTGIRCLYPSFTRDVLETPTCLVSDKDRI